MYGYGRMAQTEQFWGHLEGIWAQYQERVGRLVMGGVRTFRDCGEYGVRSSVPLRTLHIEDGNY